MPITQSQGNCQYTALTTAGTTTINQRPSAPGAVYPVNYGGAPGAFYGLEQLATGTSFGAVIYDIYYAGTATSTATLVSGTGTAGQFFSPSGSSLGVRYRGSLVAVASGTPGAMNALWD
jgi:hypothetical protein